MVYDFHFKYEVRVWSPLTCHVWNTPEHSNNIPRVQYINQCCVNVLHWVYWALTVISTLLTTMRTHTAMGQEPSREPYTWNSHPSGPRIRTFGLLMLRHNLVHMASRHRRTNTTTWSLRYRPSLPLKYATLYSSHHTTLQFGTVHQTQCHPPYSHYRPTSSRKDTTPGSRET